MNISPHPPAPRYYSQWGNIACNHAVIVDRADPAPFHDWRSDGYLDEESYRFWSLRTCGLACFQSILSAAPRQGELPKKAELISQALRWRALVHHRDGSVGGLFYAPFTLWLAQEYGIDAVSRPTLPMDEIVDLVKSGEWYIMASVSSEIRWSDKDPTRRGGHLVLIFDYQNDSLVFHNPSGLPGTADGSSCGRHRFEDFYARRGLLVKRNK